MCDADRPEATAPGDAELVRACRAGERAAWQALVGRYQSLVYTVVRRAGLDEHAAADVFQTVFQRLLEHLPRIEQPDRLRAWIVTCARREALRESTRQRRGVSLSAGDEDGEAWQDRLPDEAPLAEEALAELQELHRLRVALQQIDERCRRLLELLYLQDPEPSYQTVSSLLDMPVGSIGPTRARCLGKVRSRMA